MTILFYGAILAVAASLGTIVLYLLARKRIPTEYPNRRRALIRISFSPFLGLGWLLIALLLHVGISNGIAHQDCGLSGDPYVTLPNGYELGSHNTYDGYFKAPGCETDVPIAGKGYVRTIIDLQFSSGYFTGTQWDFNSSSIRKFTFDTRTLVYQVSAPLEKATFEDVATKAQDDPDSYSKLYAQYRKSWPFYVLLLLIVSGEATIFVLVKRLWIRITRSADSGSIH